MQGIAEPLEDLRKTNFIRYVTAHLYVLIGTDLIAAFLVFGIVAFFGAYSSYRAAAEGVPTLNRKWYARSCSSHPASRSGRRRSARKRSCSRARTCRPGHGHGAQRQDGPGVVIAIPGGWLLWTVRPHLLARDGAAAAALFVRRGAGKVHQRATLGRPIGLLVLGLLGVFAMSQADRIPRHGRLLADFDRAGARGSERAHQSGRLELQVGRGERARSTSRRSASRRAAVTVLLRPFPWEVENGAQISCASSRAAFAWFVVWRFRSIVASLRQMRSAPYLFYCWVMLCSTRWRSRRSRTWVCSCVSDR